MDIYSIGLKVDSRQVKTAQKDLGGMGRQAKNTGNSVRDFGRNVDQSQKNLGKMRKGTQLVTRALGAFGVALSVRQLQQFSQQTIVAADNINKMAQTAGVSAETLQELRFAFGKLAGTTDLEVDQSLRRFNRRLGLAADGGGAAAKAFEQLNISLRDSSGGARSSEAVLDDLIIALGGIENDSRRAALASQAFGEDAGPKLAAALAEGSGALRDSQNAANELGIVLEGRLLDGASEVRDEFDILTRQLSVDFQSVVLENKDALLATADALESLREFVKENAQEFRVFGEVVSGLIALRLGMWAAGAVTGIKSLAGAAALLTGPAAPFVLLGGVLAAIRTDMLETRQETDEFADSLRDLTRAQLENAEQSIRAEMRSIQAQKDQLNMFDELAPEQVNRLQTLGNQLGEVRDALDEVGSSSEDAGKKVSSAADEGAEGGEKLKKALDFRESIDPLFAIERQLNENLTALNEYRDALNLSDKEFARLQDLIFEKAEQAREGLKDTGDEAKDAAEKAREEFEKLADSIEGEFSDAFYNIFEDGLDSFGDLADGILDIFRRTLADMAAAAIRQQIVIPITQQVIGGAGDILSGGQSLLSGGGAGDLLGALTQPGAGGNFAGQFATSGVGQSLGLSAPISPGPGAPAGTLMPTGTGQNVISAAGAATSLAGIGGGFLGSQIGGGTQEANIGSTLGTIAGSFAGPVGSFVGGIVGGAFGGLFSDDPDPSSVKAAISAAGDVDVSVRKGDAISRDEADKLEDTFSSTLNQYTDSLDQAIENTIDSSLEEQIGDDGITTRKINKIVEKHIGGDEGSIQKGISRVMEEVTRSLTFIIPEDIHEATSRLDEEADNYGEQVMAITNAFAMSNGDLVDELRHFIDNTEATGQQFVDQLSQFSQQLQERERQIAERTRDLSTQLLQSFGRTAELIKAQLAGMTSENAALQIALNLRENVADAEQEVASAEQDLASIYRDQANEASNLADQWKGLTDTLRDAADELFGVGISQPGASRTSFRDTLQRALSGDREAFGALPQLASDLSDAERSQARTLADSRRANAQIAVELDKAANQAEKQFLEQRSELKVAERQLEKLTEQELTLRQARDNVAEARTTLKAAQDASTQAINSIGELLPENIVNGLMEPLSPLEQIDASTKAMVDLLGNLSSGTIVDESGTGTTTRPGVGTEPDDPGKSTREIVEDAYSDVLGLSGEFEDSQERMSYWGDKLNRGELSQDGFREQFVKEARVQGNLTDEQFRRNQEFLEANPPEFADGGIAEGPMSGFQATLHGTEAVIPMNGQRIPLEVNNQEMIQELRDLRQEVSQLRTEQSQSQYQIARNTKRTRDTLEQFDIEGLPPERSAT